MNIALKRFGTGVLLIVCFASTAVVAAQSRDEQDAARAARQQQRLGGGFDDARNAQRQDGMQGGDPNEGSRKSARMTPEERRALRQQIDEAGHDIYSRGKR